MEITNGPSPLAGAALDLNWPTNAHAGPVTPLIDTKTDADWAAAGPIDLATTGLFLGNAYNINPVTGVWSGTITLTYEVGSGGGGGSEPFDGDANGDGVPDGLAFLLGAATPGTEATSFFLVLCSESLAGFSAADSRAVTRKAAACCRSPYPTTCLETRLDENLALCHLRDTLNPL